ncbi:MAG: hypothetical protein WAQ98_21145 [Blastocatellia bacterium]
MNIKKNKVLLLTYLLIVLLVVSCSKPAQEKVPIHTEEEEAIARTEFTELVENFFEYEPLKTGRKSQFRIHLTDLSDGTPVEKADILLIVRDSNNNEVTQTRARVGKVTGIYVADLGLTNKGSYKIEFQIKNDKLNEQIPLTDFQVE